MRKRKSIGSDFDDWLEAEGILEEVEIAATKKAFVIRQKIKEVVTQLVDEL